MIRFIHSSDLHLGKRFGGFSGDLPGRLREARHGAIGRLAQLARDKGAPLILLAGDTFDAETPSPDIRRQALAEMRDHEGLRWVVLPGNHDSLQATQLWAALTNEAPPNVTLAREGKPIAIDPAAHLLPAPCTTRRPGRDLTAWMSDAQTGEGVVRIGLAHGPIRTFSEDASGEDVIAPDRAQKSGLDYLALGDWHGFVEIDPRTFYSGAPEQDRFKHERPGEALAVEIAGPGAPPRVQRATIGAFAWRTFPLHLLETDDSAAALRTALPDAGRRRATLGRIVASGRARLAARTALSAAFNDAAPDFAYLDLDDTALATSCESVDLDVIDRAGALREAADRLLADADDPRRAEADRDIAQAALIRLFSLAQAINT